jgi:site-specific recombinase
MAIAIKVYYHASFQDPLLSDASVASMSESLYVITDHHLIKVWASDLLWG